MSKFILLYKGPATPMDQMSPEKAQEVGAAWFAWRDKLGSSLVDFGSPMGPGQSVVDDGSDGQAVDLTGYSIVEATDMDGALKLVEGHPFLSDATGEFSIEVYELLPLPM